VQYTYYKPAKMGQALQLAKQSGQLPDIRTNAGLNLPAATLVAAGWAQPLDLSDEAKARVKDSLFGGACWRPSLHFPYEGRTFDELNTVTQAGTTVMLRREQWKLLLDERGAGEFYDLDADPAELDNRYDDPALAEIRAALTTDLARWMIRVRDDLPEAVYTLKRAPHNWH
jgi:arylsulfatase A-like enzyme